MFSHRLPIAVISTRSWILAVAFVATASSASRAQTTPTIVDSYPYCTSKSVASEQAGSTATVFMGAGGGIVRLSHDLT